jgi:flagellar motor switch protein FliM
MNTTEGKVPDRSKTAEPTVLPCNFRSAGRLSNESARTLTTLHELLARNLSNSLDVYLGTGLEVRMITLEQLSIEDFRAKCQSAGYMLPCEVQSSSNTVLLELDNALMFTMVDLLLGGSGAHSSGARELTEIDEEIMEGVGELVAQQIERTWQPVSVELLPGKCVRPSLAHRVFPLTEKVLRVQFDVSVIGVTGTLCIAFPASLASHLVRNIRADTSTSKSVAGHMPRPSLQKRILDCNFSLSCDLPDVRVPVRDLARIEVGSILTLSAPVAMPGKLTLEGVNYFEAVPVRQGNIRAMQLLTQVHPQNQQIETIEDEFNASF